MRAIRKREKNLMYHYTYTVYDSTGNKCVVWGGTHSCAHGFKMHENYAEFRKEAIHEHNLGGDGIIELSIQKLS